jgi:alpha/beta superfamily hydrolase
MGSIQWLFIANAARLAGRTAAFKMSGDNLNLRILGVDPGEAIAGARKITIRTSRGAIPVVMHTAESAARAVVCISGANGGFDGPAMLYPRLGLALPRKGVTVARVNYRAPNDFDECLLDALATLSFLKGTGHQRAAIIGHSFGGAVAINAGTHSPIATAVIAISSQLAGAHVAGQLAPKPLLLIHGTADEVLPPRCSELVYERAGEPRRLMLFEGADHRLSSKGEELFALVDEWLATRI